ncbi:MAG: hypothetical protein ACI855_000334 [Myxococcota bacterium]
MRLLLLLLMTYGLAQEPDPEADTDTDTDDVLTVFIRDTISVVDARQALTETLHGQGYHRDTQRDGDLIFRHGDAWRPVVVVSPEGHVKTRRRGFVWSPPGAQWNPDRPKAANLACLTPWTFFSCMSAQGLVTDGRKMQGERTEVATVMHSDVQQLHTSLADEHVTARLQRDLSRIWSRAEDLRGNPLPEYVQRRAAIGELWATRAPTEWGERAQDLIERFILLEVQSSSFPFTDAEADHWEASATTERSIVDR